MQPDPGGFVAAAINSGVYKMQPIVTIFAQGSRLNYNLPVSSGTVTVDRNSANRRRANLTMEVIPTVPPPTVLPLTPQSPSAPFGNEVSLQAVITNQEGASATVQMGIFAIATSTVEDATSDLTITLDCYDRSWVVSTRKFLAPYNVPATPSKTFAAELVALLNTTWGATLPALQFNIQGNLAQVAIVPSASYNEGSDPWSAAQDLAAAIGYELFFDVNGIVTALPIPVPSATPVGWTYFENVPNAPKVIKDTFTRDGIYNDFIISGTGTTNAPGATSGSNAPIRAESSDTNPASPTFVGGVFGDVPSFGQSNLITSLAQAQSASLYALQASLSSAQQISTDVLPNPLFDIDDVVALNRLRLSMDPAKFVIDTIKHTIRHDDVTVLTGRVVA